MGILSVFDGQRTWTEALFGFLLFEIINFSEKKETKAEQKFCILEIWYAFFGGGLAVTHCGRQCLGKLCENVKKADGQMQEGDLSAKAAAVPAAEKKSDLAVLNIYLFISCFMN